MPARVARSIARELGACCFALLAKYWNRPSGLAEATQKYVCTAKTRKNFKGIIWKDIGKRILNFQYWQCQLPIHFQHIPINFDSVGPMYDFLTGIGQARWAIPTCTQEKKTILPQYIPNLTVLPGRGRSLSRLFS